MRAELLDQLADVGVGWSRTSRITSPTTADDDRDREREQHPGRREGEHLRGEEPQPVGRGQQRARDRPVAPLAGDPDDREDRG